MIAPAEIKPFSIDPHELKVQIAEMSYEKLARILTSSVGAAAGQCVRVHYDTEAEQSLFNQLSAIMKRSQLIER